MNWPRSTRGVSVVGQITVRVPERIRLGRRPVPVPRLQARASRTARNSSAVSSNEPLSLSVATTTVTSWPEAANFAMVPAGEELHVVAVRFKDEYALHAAPACARS